MAAEVREYIPNVNERPRVTITSDKFKAKFTVSPKGFGVMYGISTSSGNLPTQLAGNYTTIDKAVDAVLKYERQHPGTKAVQRDEKHAAKVQRKHTEHLRERADNGEG